MENESWSTFENAEKSAAILRAAGIEQVILVTHAAHMPRAVEAFERAGLGVTAAPTVFTTTPTGDRGVVDWLPSSNALNTTAWALYEYAGRLWYWLRYYA